MVKEQKSCTVCDNCQTTCIRLEKSKANIRIIVLAVLVLISTTFSFVGSDIAFEYFSFASTITSIILSVIAILMTITSEARNGLTVGTLSKASEETRILLQQAQEVNKQIVASTEMLTANVNDISLKFSKQQEEQEYILERLKILAESMQAVQQDVNAMNKCLQENLDFQKSDSSPALEWRAF